jgi:hypothetical protein
MCTEQLPPGGYPIAVKYIMSYHYLLNLKKTKMIIKDKTTWMEAVLKSSQFLFTSTRIILLSVEWASICCRESYGNFGTVGDWQL